MDTRTSSWPAGTGAKLLSEAVTVGLGLLKIMTCKNLNLQLLVAAYVNYVYSQFGKNEMNAKGSLVLAHCFFKAIYKKTIPL